MSIIRRVRQLAAAPLHGIELFMRYFEDGHELNGRHVIFIHGYLAPPFFARLGYVPLQLELRDQLGAYSHHVFLPLSGAKSMRANIDAVWEKVVEICNTFNVAEIDLVGHSLGAICAIGFLAQGGGANVRKTFLVGGPLKGTLAVNYCRKLFPLGWLLYRFSEPMRKMGYDSEYIKELIEAVPPESKVYVFASKHDNWLITPWKSALNYPVADPKDAHVVAHPREIDAIRDATHLHGHRGHIGILTDEVVVKRIVELIGKEKEAASLPFPKPA